MFGGQLQRLPPRNSSLIYDVLLNTLDVGPCLFMVSAMSTVSRHVLFYFPQLHAQLSRVFCLKPLKICLDLARLPGCADSPHPSVVAS